MIPGIKTVRKGGIARIRRNLYTAEYSIWIALNIIVLTIIVMTIKFVDRDDELGFLSKEHRKEGFRFLSVIGRRRVCKSALMEKFITGKEAL